MPKFRRRSTIVDAERFVDADNPPPGINVNDMGTTRRYHVVTMQGRIVDVDIGEWIVRESDGLYGLHYYPVAHLEFERIFEPA